MAVNACISHVSAMYLYLLSSIPMNTLEQLRAGMLSQATRLNISLGLTEFPQEVFDLADTLEILDISGNQFASLPEDLPRLHRLRVLFCSDNPFTELPEVLGQCPNLSMVGFRNNQITHVSGAALPPRLRWLILTGNQIAELTAELGRRPLLQKLMVAGNRLKTLPAEMAACSNLELLRIAANQLEALPQWLLQLPKLAWLSYSGNPFCAQSEAQALMDAPVALVPWQALQLEHKLGEGASGVIHQAQWAVDALSAEQVAVKLFKGALTSDGLPYSEMAACMRAGAHPNLIAVRGKIVGHPEDTAGLVMSLVDKSYRNLAGPPSLESCTRDVYAPEMCLTLPEALRIAHDMASVAQQLHVNGIMHGDFYAHNILVGADGHALLGDFGAACCVTAQDQAQARALEQIEVRAFGCLVEELLDQSQAEAATATNRPRLDATRQALEALRDRCLNPNVGQRPLFAELTQQLSLLKTQISAQDF